MLLQENSSVVNLFQILQSHHFTICKNYVVEILHRRYYSIIHCWSTVLTDSGANSGIVTTPVLRASLCPWSVHWTCAVRLNFSSIINLDVINLLSDHQGC